MEGSMTLAIETNVRYPGNKCIEITNWSLDTLLKLCAGAEGKIWCAKKVQLRTEPKEKQEDKVDCWRGLKEGRCEVGFWVKASGKPEQTSERSVILRRMQSQLFGRPVT